MFTVGNPIDGGKKNSDQTENICFNRFVSVVASLYRSNCGIVCYLIYQPVCGSDGVTYSNQCMLDAKNKCDDTNVVKICDGVCPSNPFGYAVQND